MARGVFNSCAADARASRQQEQCSSLKTSKGLIGDVVAGMGTAPSPFLDSGGISTSDFLGKFPKVCFTGILSTKARPWFNGHRFLGVKSRMLYLGGDSILAQLATKSINFCKRGAVTAGLFPFWEQNTIPTRYSCSPEPQEIATSVPPRFSLLILISNKIK